MKLVSCYIDNFGMLSNRQYNFRDGINSIISPNGTGKSTLVGFIKAMLYGIGETRKVDLAENDRKKYTPWQGGRFGGSLTFTVGGKSYTVERSFGQKASLDEFRLIDTKTGAPSRDYTENLGEELFGIDREGFERTVLFSEKQLPSRNDNKSISGKLSDLVGTEFDIGEYDKAMAVLEDKRKFYFKRGGGGEIGTLKKELSVTQGALDSLGNLTERSANEKAEINALRDEISSLEKKGDKIRQSVEKIGIIKENLAKEAVYRDMLSSLKVEEDKLGKIKSFFKNEIPTQRELDENVRKQEQLSSMLAKREFSYSKDYVELDTFFKNTTSFEEIEAMIDANSSTDALVKQRNDIENERDERTGAMRALFPTRLPTRQEINLLSKKCGKKSPKISPTIAVVCTLLFALGLVLGFMASYYAFAISAIGVVIFLITILKKEPNSEVTLFIQSIDPTLSALGAADALKTIEGRLDRYEELVRQRQDEAEILTEKINQKKAEVFAYLAKFPITSCDSISEALRVIKEKYLKYYSMQIAREHISVSGNAYPYSPEELKGQIDAFIARFNVSTDSPFDEIRRMLSEYNVQAGAVERMRNQCEDYKARHSLIGKAPTPTEEHAEGDVTALKRITDEITLKRERLQTLVRQHEKTEEDYALRDELTSKQNLLIDKIASYEQELATVQNTILFLKRACDNITDRYLGKTVEGFKKYQREMSGVDGDFSLDTEFSLSKTEGSQTHSESSYSRGTRDLYALAIRLSLIDSLYESELPFIILDDPFIAFDDEKVHKARGVLKKLASNRQIIYLSCSQTRAI